jgi:hypothetical protein
LDGTPDMPLETIVVWLPCVQGDLVVVQGDLGEHMYFIGEGELEVRVYDNPDQLRAYHMALWLAMTSYIHTCITTSLVT